MDVNEAPVLTVARTSTTLRHPTGFVVTRSASTLAEKPIELGLLVEHVPLLLGVHRELDRSEVSEHRGAPAGCFIVLPDRVHEVRPGAIVRIATKGKN